ncbi:MAG: hypothetical protein RSE94_08385 [Pseudomonas sp.]
MTMDVDVTWQERSSILLGNFLKLMEGGLNTGAMTLSSTHINNLNQYVVFVRGLPTSVQDLPHWFIATGGVVEPNFLLNITSASPELHPNNIILFFSQLMAHANRWDALFAKNLLLAVALVKVAGNISATGSAILDVCAKTKALGKRREAWDALLVEELTALSPADQQIISALPQHVNAIKGLVAAHAEHVERVYAECSSFRDEAREQLIPVTVRMLQALDKSKSPTFKDTSAATLAKVKLQTRLSELSGQVEKMDELLRDVLTASSHFQSAWQSFVVYIDASQEKLQQITSLQQLARFAIYFSQFLGLWSDIEQSAKQMTDQLSSLQLSAA